MNIQDRTERFFKVNVVQAFIIIIGVLFMISNYYHLPFEEVHSPSLLRLLLGLALVIGGMGTLIFEYLKYFKRSENDLQ